MSHPFQPPPPPCRVRFETAAISRDIQAPAALVVFPDPSDPSQVEIIEQHGNRAQIVLLVATVVRWASVQGLMGDVMATIVTSPVQGQLTDHGSGPKPGTPPDDLPPHLRRRGPS